MSQRVEPTALKVLALLLLTIVGLPIYLYTSAGLSLVRAITNGALAETVFLATLLGSIGYYRLFLSPVSPSQPEERSLLIRVLKLKAFPGPFAAKLSKFWFAVQ